MSNTKNQQHNYKSIPVEKLVFNKKQPLSSIRFNAVDADISFEFAQINIILGESGTGKTELLKHIHAVVNSQVPLDYADIFFGDNIKNKQVSSTFYPFSKFLPASDMTSRYDIELLKTLIERTNEKTKQSQKSQKTSVVRDLIEMIEKSIGGTFILDEQHNIVFKRLHLSDSNIEEVLTSLNEITSAQQAFIDLLISLKFYEVNNSNFDVVENVIMLFDLPETGLHPKQIRLMAHVLFELVNRDVIKQLFVTTHSLFLMREFELLNAAQKQHLSKRFISLDNNQIEQGNDLSDLNNVSILDENLAQADRYLNLQ
jgi:putative uncharacterized protein recF3